MIRTRDFLVFTLTLVLLLTAVSATAVSGSWSGGGEVATVAKFAEAGEVSGGIAEEKTINREENITRLRSKLALGEGDIAAGEPIFTSVDDVVVATTTPIVTDQTVPESILIGHTTDGIPLMNSDLWRFVGFSETEQVGVALNSVPIFGSRVDGSTLDVCGGADNGLGYRLYLRPNENILLECYTLAR